MHFTSTNPRCELIQQLRSAIVHGSDMQVRNGEDLVRTGWPELDERLLSGGLRRGTVIEWIGLASGSGAGLLSWLATCNAWQPEKICVAFDTAREFYPPTAWNVGIPSSSLVVVHPQNRDEEHWAMQQALRCAGVALTWSRVQRLDDRSFRRLQLAAESQTAICNLVRPASALRERTWADLRLLVEPRGKESTWGWNITVVHGPGGASGRSVAVSFRGWQGRRS